MLTKINFVTTIQGVIKKVGKVYIYIIIHSLHFYFLLLTFVLKFCGAKKIHTEIQDSETHQRKLF